MKFIVTFIILIGTSFSLQAQTSHTEPVNGIQWIRITSEADVVIKAHDKNEIQIVPERFRPVSEDKTKGLKRADTNDTDNTGIDFNVSRDGSNLLIKNLRASGGEKTTIYVPASLNIAVHSENLCNTEIENMEGEIEVDSEVSGNVTITDVLGPVTISTNAGNVVATFKKINQKIPTTISTTTGEIEVRLPNNASASIFMASMMGKIHSDFRIDDPKNEKKKITDQKIKGVINNGGVSVRLSSATGNIQLKTN
ncbi:DUF4097 family beta strand repeat protein [Kordia sp. YSTF-M3]|uniref:DUF4097 family beta strand repeat protein n=1 Tax=Kordia aestuariivivens TaxID=2759037 RepID=A0ABR7QD43_9FLAO|nr:DUF4097 family beta strand repeat-containing protein [Kordia aestuariivivens]MBC8756490.1 DUF4097 family beta strand repeat protein [Kordia aestuariivivens]